MVLQAHTGRRADEAELARVERRIHSLVQAISEGAPPKALVAELRELETLQETLTARISDRPVPPPMIHPGMADLYRQKVARLTALLDRSGTRDQAMEAIRSLIEAVVLTPEAGELRIDLEGDLAGILTLCQDDKKAVGLSPDDLEQVKLVVRHGRRSTMGTAGFSPTHFFAPPVACRRASSR